MADVLTTIGGLLLGLATGFFFERRATRSAQRYSEFLEGQIRALERSVLSVGGTIVDGTSVVLPNADLQARIRLQVHEHQDAEGRVRRAWLVTTLVAEGHDSGPINIAITELCESGTMAEEGQWLMVR